MTTQQQLDSINLAIAKIEGGAQEYQIGTRRVRRGELATLYNERQRLEMKLANEQNGGVTVAVFDGR